MGPDGNILVAGFNTPGRVDELTPQGRIVWTYDPPSGPGSLDRPSLAVRWANGMIAVTDDWHHRIVVINPRTKRIVWQYGHFGVASSADGYLSKPDGLDLLPATRRGATTGVTRCWASSRSPGPRQLSVRTIGRLPSPASRVAAVALADGRILALGGIVGGRSSDEVLLGKPEQLHQIGRLPAPTHDAAAAVRSGEAVLFGGGDTVSTDRVVVIDPATGSIRAAGRLDEPLLDLGAVTVGSETYLVGGYTGARYASAVLRVGRRNTTTAVARLPVGLRYAGVASLGDRIYVAGGLAAAGGSRAIYEIDPSAGTARWIGRLPAAVAHAPLVAVGSSLYLVGGRSPDGRPLSQILRIDPSTGSVSRAGRLPFPLADAAAVTLGERAVVIGGAGAKPSDAVLELSQAQLRARSTARAAQ